MQAVADNAVNARVAQEEDVFAVFDAVRHYSHALEERAGARRPASGTIDLLLLGLVVALIAGLCLTAILHG